MRMRTTQSAFVQRFLLWDQPLVRYGNLQPGSDTVRDLFGGAGALLVTSPLLGPIDTFVESVLRRRIVLLRG